MSADKMPNANSSPYQTLIQRDDTIAINAEQYSFLNGKTQGQYEDSQMDKLELPSKNNRIKVQGTHTNQTRQIAEKDSDISEIVSYCRDVPEKQVRRMCTLKQF
jgi:hypothetical protein